jgi:arylsulfatase A-like enzyme
MPVDADTDPDLLVALRHVFAAQVTLLDRCLGTLLSAQKGRLLICVAGLRGLPLGLHDWIGGAGDDPELRLPYGELIHVPAILVDPRGRMAGQRYGGLATPADLGATLREMARGPASDVAADEPAHGRSLASLLVNWQAPLRERVIVRGAAGDALVTSEWHCIVAHAAAAGEETRLFAKPDDFFEQANVADRCRDAAAELAAILAGK